jgi:hypothetical protein
MSEMNWHLNSVYRNVQLLLLVFLSLILPWLIRTPYLVLIWFHSTTFSATFIEESTSYTVLITFLLGQCVCAISFSSYLDWMLWACRVAKSWAAQIWGYRDSFEEHKAICSSSRPSPWEIQFWLRQSDTPMKAYNVNYPSKWATCNVSGFLVSSQYINTAKILLSGDSSYYQG